MNIHYRYSKIFKVKFVRYAISTLSGINITMLVKIVFLCHCSRCLVAHQGFVKVAQNRGCGGGGAEPLAANRFLRFSHKKHSFKHTFYGKRTYRTCSWCSFRGGHFLKIG